MSLLAKSPTLPIQEAMFEVASVDPGLQALDARIFDYVPESDPRPYVVFEQMLTTPDNTHGGIGWQTVVTLSIWVEQRGYRQAHEIKNRLIEIFDHQPLSLAPDFHHVETRHEVDQELRDPRPELRRSLLRLRVVTEQE